MLSSRAVILLMSVYLVAGQRPSFAGFRPIGFPEVATEKAPTDELGNRFGDDGDPLPLPIEAKGDRDLVHRISKLPVDKQPFWYLNWKALEAQRRNQQTYEQRPNTFIDPITSNVADKANDLESKFGDPNELPTSNGPQKQYYQYFTDQYGNVHRKPYDPKYFP